ncbi:hypothetical protein EM858_04210 [Agrobacterium sp. CNPSo 2736]|uniref:hypothetical protein n=1 Tax=Agrobacterium sp. CNPSo 2736 TaxID=2499627 RepID=UPI000FD8E2E2|nr:hypothetical protein [Agrobacterium sp. CNPSo 2736]RVT80206.1 hypothetical protein EM858_04210 [Agrobacterium sp. CNPSo 2736]
MEYRKATTGDLAKVFRNSDERLTAEYITAGYNPRKVKDMFREWVVAGDAHALTYGGNPVAIIAWQTLDGEVYTSFAATPEFFEKKFVRFSRRHIKQIQVVHGNKPIVAVSYGTHPQLVRWFSLLGFQRDITQGPATLYKLSPAPNTAP